MLSEIVKTENLVATDEDIEEQIRAMIGSGAGDGEDEEGELAESAKALGDMLRQGAGRTMIVSQILTRKAIDKLARIARGEPQDEPPAEAAAVTAGSDEAPAQAEEQAQEQTEEQA